MNTRNARWLLLIIIIIASFLRLYHLTPYTTIPCCTGQATLPPGLYPDEAMNGNNALEAIRTGDYKVYYPENNGREGLFMNIQSLFLRVTGLREPWVLRLPSALLGILTVLGLYFLGKELVSREAGLLAAFFLATNFWHINFSRIGFRAIMAPFFLIWTVALLLIAWRTMKEPATRRMAFGIAILAGIIYGLGFYSYIAYRVSPILIFFIIAYFFWRSAKEGWRRQFLQSVVLFLLVTFFTALPIGIYYLQHPADFLGRTSQVSVFSSPTPMKDLATNTLKTLGMFNVSGDWNWRHNYPGRSELFWPVGVLFLIGIVVATKNIIKNVKISAGGGSAFGGKNSANNLIPYFPFSVLFIWFFIAALPVVISNEGIPHALRSILLIPPAMLFAAIGGVWIYERIEERGQRTENKRRWRTLGFALSTFLFALTLFDSYHTYFILWGQNPNTQGAFAADYVVLGRTLNTLPREAPKYIVVDAGGVLVRGVPMPAQTVMFITDSFLPAQQQEKNIHYVLPDAASQIPPGAEVFHIR